MKSQHKLLSLAGFFVKGKPFFFFTCLSKLPLEKKTLFPYTASEALCCVDS